MALPDIPAAKRAGLRVDLERLAAEGDGWLTPEDRYALKTHGVCTQLQDGVFMARVRVPGGVAPTEQLRGLGRLAARHAADWLHLTTRQNVELHWVEARHVPLLLADLARIGLSTRSACGHTLRNVMCSEDAGVGLDEPFDCLPDARLVSDAVVARSAELNCQLPSRLNIALGGSPRCREDALVNDLGLVSKVVDGVPGYELWVGGSLGKAPSLAVLLHPFVPRIDALPAVEALIDVFVAHGRFEEPAKARLDVAGRAGSEQLDDCVALVLEALRPGQRVVVQRDGGDPPPAADRLRAAGAEVLEVPVYRWRPVEDPRPALRLADAVLAGRVHAVTFTAAPAVTSWLALADAAGVGEDLRRHLASPAVVVGCVGPVCAAAARAAGLGDDVVQPRTFRLGPLVRAVGERLLATAVRRGPLLLTGTVARVDDEPVELSPTEAQLLAVLAERDGAVVPKADLLRAVWGDGDLDPHVVEVTVGRLRRRLGPAGRLVVAVPRRGYALRVPAPGPRMTSVGAG